MINFSFDTKMLIAEKVTLDLNFTFDFDFGSKMHITRKWEK